MSGRKKEGGREGWKESKGRRDEGRKGVGREGGNQGETKNYKLN